ncbi:hypothetical protein BN2476_180012 [Paraburkholderia piptadeniae]|uniref:Uncharacterized protein n=1 Tax=Paraburkholderia piptadeniae TaxID=1701573 RepID=A0A1N7RUA0_9BURK|nr:hypothetical protein BN2476_180012 [Paraburkholderia piptadeniae]
MLSPSFDADNTNASGPVQKAIEIRNTLENP